MAIERHLAMVQQDGSFRYQSPDVTVAFLPPETPFQEFLLDRLGDAFVQKDNQVSVTIANKFPPEAVAGFGFISDLSRERGPSALLGRHQKPRNHKKAIYIATTYEIPGTVVDDEVKLRNWMREVQALNACHNAIVIEGEPEDTQLRPGAHAVIISMEGDLGVITFDGENEGKFFTSMVERLELLSGSEMVNVKEGVPSDALTLEEWAGQEPVQGIAYASHHLGEHGLLWDTDLTDFGISRRQREMILFTLRQAGLGEGQISAMVDGGIMAVTETGVSKTHIDPMKGEVVPVAGITQNGTVHLILRGLPKGHPVTIFRNPSRQTMDEVKDFIVSSARRGRLGQLAKDLLKSGGRVRMDHPPSIEAHENALFYRLVSLIHAGRVETDGDFVRNLADGFESSPVLPIIPEGVEVAADCAIHNHNQPKLNQTDSRVKITHPDMEALGFKHTPPCGSLEAAIVLFTGVIDSYREFGMPEAEDEIRGVILPGHGCFLWGYQGVRKLADDIVERVEFEDYVVSY